HASFLLSESTFSEVLVRKLRLSPLLQLCHVEEAVTVLAWQLKLRRQREHGLVEIPQYGFHCAGIFMAVVYVVIQADELPTGGKEKG
ncbi:uncharacterized, partial [Tachysurus ichikawai]